jgi:hypothetical protein
MTSKRKKEYLERETAPSSRHCLGVASTSNYMISDQTFLSFMSIIDCLVAACATRIYNLRLQGSHAATRQHMIDMKDIKLNAFGIMPASKCIYCPKKLIQCPAQCSLARGASNSADLAALPKKFLYIILTEYVNHFHSYTDSYSPLNLSISTRGPL